jgi:hypothetical protein
MSSRRRRVVRLLTLGSIVVATASLGAVDGIVLIDQNRAIAGNVTPGDAPGFPVTISKSGSYRLSSNLTVPNQNTTAIDITSAVVAVTVDLNGFSIQGVTVCDVAIPPVCAPAADDVSIFGPGVGVRSAASGSITVRNGSIQRMGHLGIFVTGSPIALVENIQVRDNGHGGVFLGIANIYNSVVSRNGGDGIALNQGVVKGNLITRNGRDGVVSTGLPITVLDNTILQNGEFAIDFASTGAYGNNVFQSNLLGSVSGSGIQVSGNVCNGAAC